MPTAVKVWREGLPEPEDGDVTDIDSIPGGRDGGWLREDPAYAAELYALEVYPTMTRPGGEPKVVRVAVLDDTGSRRTYAVTLVPSVDTIVRLESERRV